MSEKFVIKGGIPLSGEVAIRGSKNAATKLMIASLLSDEESVIENIPLSQDIDITRELCETVGSSVFFDDSAHTCTIKTRSLTTSVVPRLSRRNRIPILAIGPLLHRRGFAEVPVLGGCPIGHRPVNFHFDALARMGVRIERREHSYRAEASAITGADIALPYPSVGATENIILTAVCATNTTRITNAAREPEVINLIEMLQRMGANIVFDAERRAITITGVGRLHGTRIRAIHDRNEIVSFATAALATDGSVFMRGVGKESLSAFLTALEAAGGTYTTTDEGIRFEGKRPYRPLAIETSPHPAFMTDWQQPFCVLLTQAEGDSRIHETVYEDRFGYVKDLNKMGARIRVSDECLGGHQCRFYNQTFNHSAVIAGPTALVGSDIAVTDIRAGMAHIVAALAARGRSVISGVEHIDRGYEMIDERLRGLGADIRRISEIE